MDKGDPPGICNDQYSKLKVGKYLHIFYQTFTQYIESDWCYFHCIIGSYISVANMGFQAVAAERSTRFPGPATAR